MSWPTDITAMEKWRVWNRLRRWSVIRRGSRGTRQPEREVQGHSPSQKKIVTGKENVAIVAIELVQLRDQDRPTTDMTPAL